MSKREHYKHAKSLGYSGPLKWIGSTTAQWRAIAEQLSAQASSTQVSSGPTEVGAEEPVLVHLLSIYPIRKCILSALGPAYSAVLRFVVRGLDPAECEGAGEYLSLETWSSNGHFTLLKWGLSIGMTADSFAFVGAAEHGRVDILELLAEHADESMNDDALVAAAEHGRLDVIKWMRERLGETEFECWDESAETVAVAIRCGHKKILPDLIDICKVGNRAFYWAAKIGDAKLLDWLHKHISVAQSIVTQHPGEYARAMPEDALHGAAAGGHLELLRTITDRHFAHIETQEDIVEHAIKSNNIDTVRYAAERFGVDLHACAFAALSNVEILEYIVSKINSTAPMPNNTAHVMHARAALGGNTQASEWLIAHDYPLAVGVYQELPAGEFNVETLEYLRNYGCPWDESVFLRAVRFESEQVLEWLWDHGCPVDVPACMRVIWRGGISPEPFKRVMLRPRESPVEL